MKTYLAILAFWVMTTGYSQTEYGSLGQKLFENGFDHYNEGDLGSALIVWKRIVHERIDPDSLFHGMAFFNIPTVYMELEQYEEAKEWYLKIINSDLRDSDETGWLMEPHTNYKHNSAMALAGLFNRAGNYNEKLHWLNLADTVYRYWGFEGSATSITLRQTSLLDQKIAAFMNLDNVEHAIREIVIELICSGALESFFQSSEEMLIELIDDESFIDDFDNALENLFIAEIDPSNWLAMFTVNGLTCQIPISNTYPGSYPPHYWRVLFISQNSEPDKNQIIELIKSKSFYQRLREN